MYKLIPEPQKTEYTGKKIKAPERLALGKSMLSKEACADFLEFCALPGGGKPNVLFEKCRDMENEAYVLTVGEAITIKASSAAGQLYALQTLKQIIFQCGDTVEELTVTDSPKYPVRGFMLDVGRYFFSVGDVKTILRRMALHKLNLFHFHLTEDQGWRVPIDRYPLLTKRGSVRRRTNFNNKPYSGAYTKQDIKEIVDYAHAFCIKVMPEFDIPGHSRAAIACYKNLTCFPRDLPVADHWGVKHDVLCVGKDSTMDFVHGVLDEFFEMFPDEYIHIGGDEVPKHRWDRCPDCRAKCSELGLGDSDGLQIWFMNTVKDYCSSHGKQAFMWSWDLANDDLLDSDLGFTKCGEMNTGDRPFIDTSTKAYYIDLPYGYISLDDTANHKPYDGNCLGTEVTLWTEYVPDMQRGDYVSYPRTGACAETAWNGSCSAEKFREKLDYYYSYLDSNGIGYAKPKKANPSRLGGKFEGLWFERRQLTWEGLTNIFDDKHIERIAKKQNKK